MNEAKLYYTAPSNKIFNEVKDKAMDVWREISSHPNYLSEKVGRVSTLENISDNLMFIVAMFDSNNQQKLANRLSKKSKLAIHSRIIDGGGLDSIFGGQNETD